METKKLLTPELCVSPQNNGLLNKKQQVFKSRTFKNKKARPIKAGLSDNKTIQLTEG
jgi:hypothetical protein